MKWLISRLRRDARLERLGRSFVSAFELRAQASREESKWGNL